MHDAFKIRLFVKSSSISQTLHYLSVLLGCLAAIISSFGYSMKPHVYDSFLTQTAGASLVLTSVGGVLIFVFVIMLSCKVGRLSGHERIRTGVEGVAVLLLLLGVLTWTISETSLLNDEVILSGAFRQYFYFWFILLLVLGVCLIGALINMVRKQSEDSISGIIAGRFRRPAYFMIIALATFLTSLSALIFMCGMISHARHVDDGSDAIIAFYYLGAVSPLIMIVILAFPFVRERPTTILGYTPLHQRDQLPVLDPTQRQWLNENMIVASIMAVSLQTVTTVLFHIPNQGICYYEEKPHCHDRSEDGAVAWSWWHYIQDQSNPEWLIRLPMTKAGVRSLDATTEFMQWKFGANINKYIVSGASKRGWTTYTVGAADPIQGRIIGLVPMVLDELNVVKNLHHHWRAYGRITLKI